MVSKPVVTESYRRRATDTYRRRLAEAEPESDRLRNLVSHGDGAGAPRKGVTLDALRRSALVGEDAIPPRQFESGRKVDL